MKCKNYMMLVVRYLWLFFTIFIFCPYDFRSIWVNEGSLILTMFNMIFFVEVQKADAGNLTCAVYEKIKENDKVVKDELVAMKSVPIQVRGKEL